jgi:uncharacterized protein with HEPN domain
MQRDDSLLLDMLQAARQILEYTNGLQEPDFLSSRRDQDAVGMLWSMTIFRWTSTELGRLRVVISLP